VDAARRLHAVPSSPSGLSFHVLGRLEAYYDGVELDLGPRKQRALLALLLLNANRVVSTERLIDDLWADSPPSTARATLQVYVAGLRKALNDGGSSLRTRSPGYVLEVEAGSLDLDRFTQLCADARESAVPEHRAALLHEALGLWRDEPLPELRTEPFSSTAVSQLEQLRLGALEERIDGDLALGRDAELATELESLVAEHPYRERLRAQLMLALYRSGRQADALEAYQAGRRVLQDELGLEPGKELRELEAAILRQDEALLPVRPDAAPPEPDRPLPARRFSRRAVIAAGIVGFALVALAASIAVFRSTDASDAGVSPGSVGVVDAASRLVVAEIEVGFNSELIAAGEDSVWLVDQKDKTLTRIDPETNAIFTPAQRLPAAGIPVDLAAGEGAVWIALNEGRALSVIEVDPDSYELRKRIELERRNARFPLALDTVNFAVGDGAVWALEGGRGELNRIDPATGENTLFSHDADGSSSIEVGSDAVWLGGKDGVKKIDLLTGVLIDDTSPEDVESSRTTSIAVGNDVWFVGESSDRLWRIRPVSVSIQNSIPIGQSPTAVAVDAGGAVWVASSAKPSLSRLEPATEAVKQVELGTTSGGVVYAFGRIWTSPGAAAD
jgi:DNA-binding SARP family transcriptional activator/streptogramin lyase